MDSPIMEAVELQCERGHRRLFDQLSFGLDAGRCLHIAGDNGAGKTSLLRILCGLLRPTFGEVRWQGRPIAQVRDEYGAVQMSYVDQIGSVLVAHLSDGSALPAHLSESRPQQAAQDPQQAGLAGAVVAGDVQAAAGVEPEGELVEQAPMTALALQFDRLHYGTIHPCTAAASNASSCKQQDDRTGCDRLAASDETQPLGRFAFHVDPCRD